MNEANKTYRPHIFLKGVERTVDKILGLDSHHVGEGSGEKAVAEDKLYIDRCIGCKYWLKDIIEQHANLKKRHKLYLRCASQNLHSYSQNTASKCFHGLLANKHRCEDN